MIDGSLGRVKSAVFQRLGTPPAWSPQFYRDNERTGGALVKLKLDARDGSVLGNTTRGRAPASER